MLTNKEHPAAWAMLVYELADAHEHLGELIALMNHVGEIDESEYRVRLGHVFAHLNRAWHSRDDAELANLSDTKSNDGSKYPVDLLPIG